MQPLCDSYLELMKKRRRMFVIKIALIAILGSVLLVVLLAVGLTFWAKKRMKHIGRRANAVARTMSLQIRDLLDIYKIIGRVVLLMKFSPD